MGATGVKAPTMPHVWPLPREAAAREASLREFREVVDKYNAFHKSDMTIKYRLEGNGMERRDVSDLGEVLGAYEANPNSRLYAYATSA